MVYSSKTNKQYYTVVVGRNWGYQDEFGYVTLHCIVCHNMGALYRVEVEQNSTL